MSSYVCLCSNSCPGSSSRDRRRCADGTTIAEQDEKEAIDKSNIIKDRTRHAKPEGVGYSEGPEEDDLPKNVRDGLDGRSAVHTGILKEPSA